MIIITTIIIIVKYYFLCSNKALLAQNLSLHGHINVMPLQWSSYYQSLYELVHVLIVERLCVIYHHHNQSDVNNNETKLLIQCLQILIHAIENDGDSNDELTRLQIDNYLCDATKNIGSNKNSNYFSNLSRPHWYGNSNIWIGK